MIDMRLLVLPAYKMGLCLVTILLGISLNNELHAQTRVLFVGNSYTAANNLPQLFSDLSSSLGDSVITAINTPGGYTLQMHSGDASTLSLIQSQPWDYVVLQEQSQRPSFPQSQVAVEVYPYATQLDSLIRLNNTCTETVFYMTWGRKYGDVSNCAIWPPVCTFSGMQHQLRQSYLQMADDNNALVAPCGMAWQQSWNADSSINLWVNDNSHPSVEGSYLNACVFYATVFRKSPVGATYTAGLQPQTANHLQQVAHQTVFDSLATWNIGAFDPLASFSVMVNSLTTQFTFTGTNCSSYNWDFGDGQTASSPSPQHIYSQPGIYTVSLIAGDGCTEDTATQTLNLGATGISPVVKNDCIEQRGDAFHFKCKVREVLVYTADGRLVESGHPPTGTDSFTVRNLSPAGVILVFTLDDGRQIVRKIGFIR